MGLLPTDVRQVIEGKDYSALQTYYLQVPDAIVPTSYQTTRFHDDVLERTVIDHGVLKRVGFNKSMKIPGTLNPGEYKFTVDNREGGWLPDHARWVHSGTLYRAQPSECRVWRYLSIRVGSSFTIIDSTQYNGKIVGTDYRYQGFNTPLSLTMTCRPIDLRAIQDYKWGSDDLDEIEIAPGESFLAPLPEDN